MESSRAAPGLQSSLCGTGRWALVLLVAACIEAAWFTWRQDHAAARPEPLSEGQLTALASLVESVRDNKPAATPIDGGAPHWDSVYAALWRDGQVLGQAWGKAGLEGVAEALEAAQQGVEASAASVELSLACCFRELDPQRLGGDLTPAQRGVRGLEVSHDGRSVRYAPSQMVAENLSFERALSRAAKLLRLDGAALIDRARLRTFEASQVLVTTAPSPQALELFRGQRTLPPQSVHRQSVARFAAGMREWMLDNLHRDGRMTCMYYSSSGRESNSNNMIRQWMATLALVRVARIDGEVASLAAARRNIDYNLEHFYRREGELGVIQYRGQVKLGAVALAALALLEFPGPGYQRQLQALVATTDALWQPGGEFRNFLRPERRNGEPNFHNFYPGETLLLWAGLLQRAADPAREQRFLASVDHYRQWHREHRRPAFIPWHTQAAYQRWQATGSPDLAEWIFEMNDWLLRMQARPEVAYPDTRGRFHDPRNPGFGPPHASSTGVYLEGLVDAWALAVELGDTSRAARYRAAIIEGLRSAMQLQFRDDPSMWYVTDRERVRGGLRTTVYNNVIRVDNVQHTLLAVQKILAADGEIGALLPPDTEARGAD